MSVIIRSLVKLQTLIIVMLLIPSRCTGASELQAMSVCDVLNNLETYQNKIVPVRGILRQTGLHGDFIMDDAEQIPCAGQEQWAPGINLLWPERVVRAEGPIDFEIQRAQIRSVWAKIVEIAPNPHDCRITAVFHGKIESRPGITIRTFVENGKRGWHGNGYGHLGKFTAQLILEKMTDVWVECKGERVRIEADETSNQKKP